MRSESMNNFGECDLKHDSYRDTDAVYQCPHNKALADDFKYMRNKPTIIAFKTPSVDEYERRRSNESILTIGKHLSVILSLLSYFCDIYDDDMKSEISSVKDFNAVKLPMVIL